MEIKITTDTDMCACETCGSSYAEGGFVEIDGEKIIDLPAFASCSGGDNYSADELLVLALHKLGHTVIVDDDIYFIPCHNDDYHGKLTY